jgi:MFS family permease
MGGFVDGITSNPQKRSPRFGLFLLILFTIYNTLDNADKTIIGGSFDSVSRFLRADLHSNSIDAAFGSLTSAFIVGFSLSAVAVGQVSRRYPQHNMATIAILAVLWCGSIVICSTASSYAMLLAGRALSGLGEAAWLTIVPPILLDLGKTPYT